LKGDNLAHRQDGLSKKEEGLIPEQNRLQLSFLKPSFVVGFFRMPHRKHLSGKKGGRTSAATSRKSGEDLAAMNALNLGTKRVDTPQKKKEEKNTTSVKINRDSRGRRSRKLSLLRLKVSMRTTTSRRR